MYSLPTDLFVYEIGTSLDGNPHFYVSPLPNEFVFKRGLPREAILGELTNGPGSVSPEHFQQNTTFIQFLGWVIAKHATQCNGLIAEARRQKNGYVYIIDLRTQTPTGAVPPEDVIGGVEVEQGELLRFHGSPNYRLLTSNGFMQLDGWIRQRLLEELIALPHSPTNPA